MAIFKLLDCSTGHITREDMHLLDVPDEDMPDPCIGKTTGGWLLWVFHEMESIESLSNIGFSPEFVSLIKYARAHGCERIQLDQDGDRLDELPFFDW